MQTKTNREMLDLNVVTNKMDLTDISLKHTLKKINKPFFSVAHETVQNNVLGHKASIKTQES